MADAMDVFYRTIKQNHTEVDLGTRFFADPSIPDCVESGHILRMDPTMSFSIGNGLVRIESKYPVGLRRPIDYLCTPHIVRPASGVAEGLSFRQISLALSQSVLCLFSIVNVGRGTVPTDDLAVGVAVRIVEKQEPAILPVSLTKAGFGLERGAARNAILPGFPKPRLIVGMQVPASIAIVQKLLQRHAPKIQGDLIGIQAASIGIEHHHLVRNSVHQLGELSLCLFAILDIRSSQVPPNDDSLLITQGVAADQEPAILSVSSA